MLRLTGTEPFWGGEVDGTTLTYSTPENQDGTAIAVERFAGRGGIAFSGLFDGADFEMTVTLEIGEDKRNGCAWSEQHPFEGAENP